MYLGVFVELGLRQQVTERPLHPYTKALLETAPDPVPSYRRTPHTPLVGEIPSPLAPPSGCRFRTRCPVAMEVCASVVPELRELRPGQFAACHRSEVIGQ
jgi:oligopeptide/dipeptide ABC transporter ATP-binding protein